MDKAEGRAPVTLGTSLLVPSVQELARKPLATVPQRYVREDHRDDPSVLKHTCAPTSSLPTLPVVDLNCLLYSQSAGSELERLHFACKDWGFFQLVNHGVSSSLVEKVKSQTQEFFNLSMEEKQKFWQQPGEIEGFGQAFVVSEEQKLDWADMFFMTTLPKYLRKPHLFPMLPLHFRETMEEYSLQLKNLAMTILEMMAKALKIETEELKLLFEDGLQAMRMNYYPPCPQPEQVIGLTPHSDAVGLTILLQVNEMEGLQIRKDGMWVPVNPLPNAFVVNIGDILEMVTNGTYRSIEHRATVNSSKERLSIATFYSPNLNKEISPAPGLIKPESPPLFKRISAENYFNGLFARELDGKSYLDNMRIQL